MSGVTIPAHGWFSRMCLNIALVRCFQAENLRHERTRNIKSPSDRRAAAIFVFYFGGEALALNSAHLTQQ